MMGPVDPDPTWPGSNPWRPPAFRPGKAQLVKAGVGVLLVAALTAATLSRLPADAHSGDGSPAPSGSGPAPTTATAAGIIGASAGPSDPSASAPPAERLYGLTATVLNPDQVTIAWQSDQSDITGWDVARDGTDDNDYGPWHRELPPTARTHTFNILVAGFAYTFTLTPLTAGGPGPAATITADPAVPTSVGGTGGGRLGGPAVGPSIEQPAGAGVTAAARLGWGEPLPASDEFNYTGPPDSARWSTISGCGPGHVGNGLRCGANSQVNGSALVQTGTAGGETGWMASKLNQRYGRWEARVRSMNTGAGTGREYHPLLIIWPDREDWPRSGEYDFLENGAPGEACAEAFIHYPHPPGNTQQEHARQTSCTTPLSEWHTFAIDWRADGITGYVDGQQWFSYSGGAGPGGRSAIQAMPNGHLTIQLDNMYGGGLTPARYEVDWVRIYRP